MLACISTSVHTVRLYCSHKKAIAACSAPMETCRVLQCRLARELQRILNMDEHKRITAITSGAIGLGSVASFIGFCCIGPWAVTLFGVPGAIALARYDYLRSYIVGLATVLLVWAYWRVYRSRPVCTDASCAAEPSIWLQASLWIATLLLLAAFFANEIQWLIIDPTPEGLR